MNKPNSGSLFGNKKMCVMVNSLAGGGAEKVVATLYPEYQKAGVEVSLLCLEENNFYNIDGVSPSYLSSQTGVDEGGVKKLLSLFSFALRLKKYIAINAVDLVQSHIYRCNYVNILARVLGAKHKIQLVNHGMPGQYRNEGLSGRVNLQLIKWLYPKADQIICPSQGMINEFIQLGIPVEKLKLIRNPFDLKGFRSLEGEDVAQSEFIFDPDKKYLIFIGRLESVKRIEDILWAFYELQKDMDGVELLVLGEGEKADDLMALVMRLAMGKKVHLLGQVENPHKYLTRSDVLVAASEFEGFSNVIVEALIAGVPVISTDCESGPREILSPNIDRKQPIPPGSVEKVKHGLMIPVGDIKAMTKAMSHMLNDGKLQEQFSKVGKIRAEDFDKESIAKTYLEKSKALLGDSP